MRVLLEMRDEFEQAAEASYRQLEKATNSKEEEALALKQERNPELRKLHVAQIEELTNEINYLTGKKAASERAAERIAKTIEEVIE